MHLHIDFDHDDFANPARHQSIRAAAFFLLHTIGDIASEDTTPAYNETPPAPTAAPIVTAPATGANTAVASVAANTSTTPPAPTVSVPVSNVPPPPPPPPNVPPPPSNESDDGDETPATFSTAGNVPPPPPSATTAATPGTAAPSTPTAGTPGASSAAGAPGVASVELDSSNMPYDVRIHQKAKGKKRDGTWKLIKGIDPAVVQAVTAELAARKGASAPVSLPAAGSNSVPVPPVSDVPAPPGVPAPPAAASAPVPVPPVPAVGGVGGSPYRALIDKITELTKAGKLAPTKVAEICQTHGAPSLMALNSMQTAVSARDPGLTVLQAVDKDIDAAALGLL